MCELPINISDTEKIVRIVLENHLNKPGTGIKPRIFRPKSGTDEVSVIRADFRDATFCKQKAKERESSGGFKYVGLAVVIVGPLRETNSNVYDSRDEYCGHAHISHGITPAVPNEPLTPLQLKALDDRTELIRNLATFYKDPDPDAESWIPQPF